MHQVRSLDTRASITDLFCGCGGSSTGAVEAGLDVDLALNHWELAIKSHSENHPDTAHDCVDISAARPDRYPSTRLLWASPECTNHSLAKGTKYKTDKQGNLFSEDEPDPARERSRCTMWDIPRFTEWHEYEYIVVENVPDARRWRLWDAWIKAMHDLGYKHQSVYFNSMFAPPTPQSRNRLYVVFWREENEAPDLDIRPTAWCERCNEDVGAVQSWRDTGLGNKQIGLRYGVQYEYRCPNCAEVVKPYRHAGFNVIDWSIKGEMIGERDQPLAEKTRERIEQGLEDYKQDPLLIQQGEVGAEEGRRAVSEVEEDTSPVGTLAPFLQKQNSGRQRPRPLTEPVGAQTTSRSDGIVMLPPHLVSVNYFDGRVIDSVGEEYPTQTTQRKWGVLTPPVSGVDLGGEDGEASGPGILAGGARHSIIEPEALQSFIEEMEASNEMGTSGEESPTHPDTAPKDAIEDVDVDECHFRMLKPHEIKRAMGFPESYEAHGTMRERTKQYGNSVTPPVATVLLERCLSAMEK